MLRIEQNENGEWNVVDSDGLVLVVEKTNAAAWRAVERLETRVRGRKSKLYQSDAAISVSKDR